MLLCIGVSGVGKIHVGVPLVIDDENILSLIREAALNNHQVGDVLKSLLSETEFVKLHGTKWVLMDGRGLEVTDKLRILTGWTHLPNGTKGNYLMNVNAVGLTNDPLPETLSAPRSMDSDTTTDSKLISHFHYLKQGDGDGDGTVSISSSGGHTHTCSSVNIGGPAESGGGRRATTSSSSSTESKVHSHPNSELSGSTANSVSENHEHTFKSDPSTELNSVLVNFFIKIN